MIRSGQGSSPMKVRPRTTRTRPASSLCRSAVEDASDRRRARAEQDEDDGEPGDEGQAGEARPGGRHPG